MFKRIYENVIFYFLKMLFFNFNFYENVIFYFKENREDPKSYDKKEWIRWKLKLKFCFLEIKNANI